MPLPSLAQALLLVMVSPSGPLAGQEPALAAPPAMLKSLEAAARLLARNGRSLEAQETLDVMASLGLPPDQAAKLELACRQEAARAAQMAPAVPDAARTLQDAATSLARLLAPLDAAAKTRLAQQILRLDDRVETAHLALGHEHTGDGWISAEERLCRDRRTEVQEAMRRARHLTVPIEITESAHPLLVAAHGRKGIRAACAGYTVHSVFTGAKVARLLREAVRAAAFATCLVKGGDLRPPVPDRDRWPATIVLMDSRDAYLRAVAEARRTGTLRDQDREHAEKLSSIITTGLERVVHEYTEGDVQAWMMCDLCLLGELGFGMPGRHQPGLEAGYLNWVCLSLLGASIPRYTFGEGRRVEETGRTLSEAVRREREERMRLAEAGLFGCRSWMVYLAQRREDPPWLHSMADAMGKIAGEDLMKATMVVEFLQEQRRLPAILAKTRPTSATNKARPVAKTLEEALGEDLAHFEERWRGWLLGQGRGLVQRLEAPPGTLAKGRKDILDILNGLRRQAFAHRKQGLIEVSLDEDLSRGARRHAEYLGRNREQSEAWPDAHEELSDREGFTPEGAWAGVHSVIAPGTTSAREAVDTWMGTFYHRLPLLDPGLLRVGWGLEQGIAVLDASSLARPTPAPWTVAWPPDGMTKVPLRFHPELPNPVPDSDQTQFGYPVTLQLLRTEEKGALDVTMKLLEGSAKGPEVRCHFSSPSKPSNIELAPANAFCLIPKAPLKPGTTYVVIAEIGLGERISWTFKT